MKLIRLKHEMDKEYRILSLDDAFIEALSMANSCSCEAEIFEDKLFNIINNFQCTKDKNMFLSIIDDEYKLHVLKGYGYKFDEHVWLNNLKLIESSIDAYPLSVNSSFIAKMVNNIHNNKLDLIEGDLMYRIRNCSGYNYRLCEVDLDNIDYKSFYVDESLVEEYISLTIDEMPPIVLEMPFSYDNELLDEFPIIDGVHRCLALKELGLDKIKAYIPIPV